MVSWKSICLPKTEGGLGLKDLSVWNKVVIARQICLLFSTSGSLWIAWVRTVLLKDKSFWLIRLAANSSWNWRTLLQLRPAVKPHIKYNIGNGNKILFWLDDWHPKGQLLSAYSLSAVLNSNIPLYATLFLVIKDSCWVWPSARSSEMLDI